jgi:hypothetical protein
MNVVGFFLRCYYAQNGRLFFNRFLQGLTMSLQYYVIFVFFEEFFDIAPKNASEEKLKKSMPNTTAKPNHPDNSAQTVNYPSRLPTPSSLFHLFLGFTTEHRIPGRDSEIAVYHCVKFKLVFSIS